MSVTDGSFSSLFGEINSSQQRGNRQYHPIVGTVVANQDPEKLGRIKVQYQVLIGGGSDTSHWLPMAVPGGGKDRGWWFLPELEDEVLLMFVDGDINNPVVLGALWNGKDSPSDKNDGANERRVLVSRAGSRIVLNDDDGTVTIEDGTGIGKIVVSADNRITIEAKSGDVCIQAPNGELSLVAKNIIMNSETAYIYGGGGGVRIGSSANVTFSTTVLGGEAPHISLNSGGAKMAKSSSASPKAIPDPVG